MNIFDDLGRLIGDLGNNVVQQVVSSFINEQSTTTVQQKYNTIPIQQSQLDTTGRAFLSNIGVGDAEKQADFDKLTKQYDIRYGKSYADFDDLVSSFNVSRLPSMDHVPMPFCGHIIMSRPSLYAQVSTSVSSYSARGVNEEPDPIKNFNVMRNHPKMSAFVNDRYGQLLLRMLSIQNNDYYMPLFTTQAMSYTVGDVQLKSVEKGQTYYGHVIKYGHYSEEHKIGGTISIDFRNDYYYSILKTIYIWMMYIDIVSRGDAIKPSNVSQLNAILDYCGSIYYLVTDASMSRLVYWEKLTGVFPRNAPFSMFSYSDNLDIADKLTVEFDYGIKSDPCDPNVLFDINMLSAKSYSLAAAYMQYGPAYQYGTASIDYSNINDKGKWANSTRPDSFQGPFGLGDAFAKKPIIQAVKNGNTLNYYLHWLKY